MIALALFSVDIEKASRDLRPEPQRKLPSRVYPLNDYYHYGRCRCAKSGRNLSLHLTKAAITRGSYAALVAVISDPQPASAAKLLARSRWKYPLDSCILPAARGARSRKVISEWEGKLAAGWIKFAWNVYRIRLYWTHSSGMDIFWNNFCKRTIFFSRCCYVDMRLTLNCLPRGGWEINRFSNYL